MRHAALLALFLLAGAASAGTRDDYVREWPLELGRDDGGAYRVVLTREMYATAHDVLLGDIEIFNAAGESVPSALLGASDSPVEWLDLTGRRVEENGVAHVEYALDARVPVERIDLVPPDNSVEEWSIASREGERWTWQHRVERWLTYAVVDGGGQERSPPQRLAERVRDRRWRADSARPANGMPTLRVGWRPEQMVFLAQGPGPYTLAAGSTKARRTEAPIARLLAELRARRGADWQPYPATLAGEPRTLAGPRAVEAPAVAIASPPSVRWESWLLWTLLVGGAVLITGMSLALLRKRAP